MFSGIQEILVRRHPDWADYHTIAHPRTYHEAQVSLPYSVAIALTEGLLCLARLLRAGRTTTPLGANLSSRLAVGTRLRAALAGLVNDDGEGKGRHDVL